MRIDFERVKKQLEKKYKREKGEKKDYYINEEGKVVATIDKEETIITTYFDDKEDILESHYRKIVVVFAKNMMIICDNTPMQIEAMFVDKLLGTDNDTQGVSDFKIQTSYNLELEEKHLKSSDGWPQRNIGTIGFVTENGDDLSFITNEIRITIGDKKLIHPNDNKFNIYLLSVQKTIELPNEEIQAYLNKYGQGERRTYRTLDEPQIEPHEQKKKQYKI